MFKANKNNSIKIAAVAVCGLAAVVTAGCGGNQSEPQIGLVDHQLVSMSHPSMAEAQQTMKDEYSKIQNELVDTASLSEESRQVKVDGFRQRLADKEREVMTPVQKSADSAVDEIRKKEGMSVVIDKRVAVAGGKDITKQVLMQEGLSDSEADAAISKAEK